MLHRHPFHPALSLLVCVATGCFVDTESPLPADFGQCAADPGGEPVIDRLVTYAGDAKPILDAKCASCHKPGDIAPFALETYEDVFLYRDAIRDAVQRRTMPPWQPDDCCNHYLWDRSLSAQERALLLAWVDQGALAGDPQNPAPPPGVDSGGLSRVDLTLTMPEPFTPKAVIGRDEIRCFVLDWPFDRDIHVTGINVVPGDRTMVHHVIVYTVEAGDLPALRARDGEDGRPGWDCYGQFGGESRPTGSIGGWAPGYRGVEFPDGLGRKVAAGSGIVLNVHYDTGSGMGADQTSVELMVTETVAGELNSTGVVNPLWLVGDAMAIPAGDPDATAFFSYDPTVLMTGGKPFFIYAVNLHMHELGSIGRLAILRADGTSECLLNITRWDFSWLGDYFLQTPVLVNPGDQLYVECHWDNTAPNQKIVDGVQQEPRDIHWGTDAEMCAGVLTIRKL